MNFINMRVHTEGVAVKLEGSVPKFNSVALVALSIFGRFLLQEIIKIYICISCSQEC